MQCRSNTGRGRGLSRLSVFEDKIHYRLGVFLSGWEMSLALLQDNRDLAAELLVSLFQHAGLALKPGVEAAANVE